MFLETNVLYKLNSKGLYNYCYISLEYAKKKYKNTKSLISMTNNVAEDSNCSAPYRIGFANFDSFEVNYTIWKGSFLDNLR